MTRQEANLKIVEALLDRVRESPHERFQQMLWNLNIIDHMPGDTLTVRDRYNEESDVTLKKLNSSLRTTK